MPPVDERGRESPPAVISGVSTPFPTTSFPQRFPHLHTTIFPFAAAGPQVLTHSRSDQCLLGHAHDTHTTLMQGIPLARVPSSARLACRSPVPSAD